MEFLQKYRHILVGIIIVVTALQIPIYWKQDRSLGVPGRILYTLAYYPQLLGQLVFDGIDQVTTKYVYLIHTQAENEGLKAENAILRGELYRIEDIHHENQRLRTLLQMRERNQYHATGARIIGLDGSSWFRSFMVNAGSRDGIERGMPAVTHEGLVGTVVAVSGRSSKVLPIVDVHSSVEVVSARTRDRAILVGRGSNRLFLNYLERSADVQPGDIFVTSGFARMFPQGLPVGIVSDVRQKSYGLFQEAYLDPIVNFRKLETMLLLHYRDGESVPDFQPAPVTDATSPLLVGQDSDADKSPSEVEPERVNPIEARTPPPPRARAVAPTPPPAQPTPTPAQAAPTPTPAPAPVEPEPPTPTSPQREPQPAPAPPAPISPEPEEEPDPEPVPAPTPAPPTSEPAPASPEPVQEPEDVPPAAPSLESAPLPSMPSALPRRTPRTTADAPDTSETLDDDDQSSPTAATDAERAP